MPNRYFGETNNAETRYLEAFRRNRRNRLDDGAAAPLSSVSTVSVSERLLERSATLGSPGGGATPAAPSRSPKTVTRSTTPPEAFCVIGF